VKRWWTYWWMMTVVSIFSWAGCQTFGLSWSVFLGLTVASRLSVERNIRSCWLHEQPHCRQYETNLLYHYTPGPGNARLTNPATHGLCAIAENLQRWSSYGNDAATFSGVCDTKAAKIEHVKWTGQNHGIGSRTEWPKRTLTDGWVFPVAVLTHAVTELAACRFSHASRRVLLCCGGTDRRADRHHRVVHGLGWLGSQKMDPWTTLRHQTDALRLLLWTQPA